MNKYVITGFSGFVSFFFLDYLNSTLDEKISVLGLDIIEPKDFKDWDFNKLDIAFKKVNLLNKNEIANLLGEYKPDYILHLAALSSVGKSWEDPVGCFTNNTGIFLNLVETVKQYKLNCKLLCIGSSEEYGFVDSKNIPISESFTINPSSPYAVTKVAQEGLCRCYVAKYGININLTRSFNHIGPRQKEIFVIASFCKQIAQAYVIGKKEISIETGNLNVVRDFLDVRDVVTAYYKILQKGKPGELYNVCSGNGYQLKDILSILEDISGIKINTITNPDFIRPNDIPIIIGNNKKIVEHTGWKPRITIKQSLTDIFNYWIDQVKNL